MTEQQPTITTTVTLRALEGAPLVNETIRDMVIANAHAIAERQGVRVMSVASDDASVTVTLAADRLTAIGFAAELRRLTEHWHRQKYGSRTLWGEVRL